MPAAMILAAGLGERMRPLTVRRAKPTLPVLGASSLARLARAARRARAVRIWSSSRRPALDTRPSL